VSEAKRFEPDPLLAVRVAPDRVVLVPLARADAVEDNLFMLEESAVLVWPLLAAGKTLAQVSEAAGLPLDELTALAEEMVERQILRPL